MREATNKAKGRSFLTQNEATKQKKLGIFNESKLQKILSEVEKFVNRYSGIASESIGEIQSRDDS